MIVVETFLICDGGCGKTHGVDNRHITGAKHRKKAKEDGWRTHKNKDYCPECYIKIQANGTVS